MKLSLHLFILIIIFWNLMGALGAYLMKFLAMLGIIPYELSYPYLLEALSYQFVFIFILYISFCVFYKKNKIKIKKIRKKNNVKLNYIFLCLIIINNITIIFSSGIILLSGDYSSRFESGVSAIQVLYIPFIFWGLFILNIYNGLEENITLLIKKYGVLIVLCIVTGLLNATRGFTFFIIISLGWFLLYHYKVKINLKFVLKFIAGFIIIYFGGQLINVLRTYKFDFTIADLMRAFAEDSFNEIRSFATLLYDEKFYTLEPNFLTYINDFISRLIPSFVYNFLGYDRAHFWNASWESISSYIWVNKEVEYGLRFGLVGDIYIYAGKMFLLLIGILYGKLLTIDNKYSILLISYLIYSIPYGFLSLTILVQTIILYNIIRLILK